MMTAAGQARFLKKTHATLTALFPASLRFEGKVYAGAGAGGLLEQDAEDGGFVERIDRAFRISKALLTVAPEIGQSIFWLKTDGKVEEFKIVAVPDRLHETEHYIGCQSPDA